MSKTYWVLTVRRCPVCCKVFRSWVNSKRHFILCGADSIEEEYTLAIKEES